MPDMSSPFPDAVVIGGGIVGTSAAAFLAGAGARVLLLERDGLASGASGANSGIVQHPFDPVLAALYRETLGLYRDLTAADVGFRLLDAPAGMLFVSAAASAARRQAEMVTATFPELTVDVLGEAELQRTEPAAAPGLWACRVDIGYPVAPGASTYGYATLAERRGVEIRQGRAASLELDGDRVIGVVANGRSIAAGMVLVAAGPWTPEVIDPTGRWRPIRPLWGAVVEAELSSPPHHLFEEAGIDAVIGVPEAASSPARADHAAGADPHVDNVDFSLVPLPGASVVGSTFLPVEPDVTAWMEPILVRATRFVPGVADAPIRGAHACARPQSDDGRPLIGAVPGRRGLYVCAGHGPWGISSGPASARLATDLMLGRAPAIPRELDPARFPFPD
jgi:glycine/D-amino acid oxidase-like deaminating enzyme